MYTFYDRRHLLAIRLLPYLTIFICKTIIEGNKTVCEFDENNRITPERLLFHDFFATKTKVKTVQIHYGGGRVGRRSWVPRNPTIWIMVGQGPTVLSVGEGGAVWTFFLVYNYLFFLALPGSRPRRWRLKYCLKRPANKLSTE